MIPRLLSKIIDKSPKSTLLLGPRQTGKSTLIQALNPALSINLMREDTYLDFASNPRRLEELIHSEKPKTLFIDEIQRLPSLLNSIQVIIDESKSAPKFYLTGSSARKLKHGSANLLPGRLFTFRLGPFVAAEFNYQLNKNILSFGSLPEIYLNEEESFKKKLLTSYTGSYLKEEIQAESLTKNLEGFARFLLVAASEATRFLDLTKLAQQARVDRSSAVRWFEILEDTLLVYRVEAYGKNTRKRLVQHPRYFLYDNGILNALLKNFTLSTDRIGFLFENLFASQLFSSSVAFDKEISVSNYRTTHGAEIDFIVEHSGKIFAIECKGTERVEPGPSLRSFESFKEVCRKPHRRIIAYLGDERLSKDGVEILPWQEALRAIRL